MEKKKNGAPHRDFRKNDKNNDRHDRTPRRDFKKEVPTPKGEDTGIHGDYENGAVIGRNAVGELLKSGRNIDKLLVQKGERTGSIVVLVAQAIERGIPVIETEKPKLDAISGYAPTKA